MHGPHTPDQRGHSRPPSATRCPAQAPRPGRTARFASRGFDHASIARSARAGAVQVGPPARPTRLCCPAPSAECRPTRLRDAEVIDPTQAPARARYGPDQPRYRAQSRTHWPAVSRASTTISVLVRLANDTSVAEQDRTLKVATRVRIPLGVPARRWSQRLPGSGGPPSDVGPEASVPATCPNASDRAARIVS